MRFNLKSLLIISLLFGTTNLFAFDKDRYEALINDENEYWIGTYLPKYVDRNTQGSYHYSLDDLLNLSPQKMAIKFFPGENGVLTYHFFREVFPDNNLWRETDVKRCYKEGLTLPRQVFFKDDVPNVNPAELTPAQKKIMGIFAKVENDLKTNGVSDKVIGVIVGKKCVFPRKQSNRRRWGLFGNKPYYWDKANPYISEEPLIVPVIGVKLNETGDRLEMKVIVANEEYKEVDYQGYTTYVMQKQKRQ